MKKIKIAQIGMNRFSHANAIFETLKKQSEHFEIVGYCLPENERDRIPDKMYIFDGYPELSLEEILNNPEIEAVTIETDEIYLTKYALMAVKAGKHIHMEKPGGRELEDFEELISVVKQNGRAFNIGYMYRYNPYVKEALEKAKNGEYGKIVSVEAQMNCWHPDATRQWLSELPGGMMFYLGCHLVDLIYRLQGEPKNVIAMNKCSGLDNVTADDFSMAVFEYENGVSFAKTTAVENGGFLRRQLIVNGSKATVELKPLEECVDSDLLRTGRKVRYGKKDWNEDAPFEYCVPVDRYDAMMADFAAMCRGEKYNEYTPEYELGLYRLLLKACGQ